jgi:hypothetical protein
MFYPVYYNNLMEHKCTDCGKQFKWDADLRKHNARKTPCVKINVGKPQCEYCDKLFVNQGNLNKHLKICKINRKKDDDVKEINNTMMKLLEQNKILLEKMQQLENKETQTVVNNTIINNNVFVFATIEQPKIDTLQLTLDDAITNNMYAKMIEKIYFNENIPENHILFIPNKKEKKMEIYKGPQIKWQLDDMENFKTELAKVIDTALNIGKEKYLGADGIIKTEEQIQTLELVIKNSLTQLRFHGEPKLKPEDVFKIALKYKDMIKATKEQHKNVT